MSQPYVEIIYFIYLYMKPTHKTT